MSLSRLLLAWVLVSAWFLAVEQIEKRLAGSPAAGRLRAGWRVYLADALLLTLFAGLWFASLGHGGWVLLFALTGFLMEGPARYRDGAARPDWSGTGLVRVLAGVSRIVVAGGILAWTM